MNDGSIEYTTAQLAQKQNIVEDKAKTTYHLATRAAMQCIATNE